MKRTFEFLNYVVDKKKLLRLVLTLLLFALCLIVCCRAQENRDTARFEAEKAELVSGYETRIQELTASAEAGIYASQYLPQDYMGEAYPLAQWLDCLDRIYPGLTAEAKALACWVVINRMDSSLYPDDVLSVLQQEGQFCEFDDGTPPTEGNVTTANNQLARYYNGDIRPAPPSAVFITVSTDGVVLRDNWEETAQTGHWRA